MEFQYVTSGNVEALREWLRKYPQRVHIPSPGTKYTLIHTAVLSKQLSVVRVLMNEFHADASIPCGGKHETAVHAAARMGDPQVLAALLEHRPPLRENVFGESPMDMISVQARGKTSAMREECQKLLMDYQKRMETTPSEEPTRVWTVAPPNHSPSDTSQTRASQTLQQNTRGSLSSPVAPGQLRAVIEELRVSSDDEGVGEGRGAVAGGPKRPTPAVPTYRFWNSKGSQGNSALSSPMVGGMLRNVRDITGLSTLPFDLQGFRRVYGNGFKCIETTATLQVRGILPYTFKGAVYYTPVILIAQKQDTATPSTGIRYRAIIDRENIKPLFINRRAVYIDPLSGVIIPNDSDARCSSLVEFVKRVVVANFEHIPPLTNQTDPTRSVQEAEALFKRQLDRREARLLILREVSMFCDETFTYDTVLNSLTGLVPLLPLYNRPLDETEDGNGNAALLNNHSSNHTNASGVGNTTVSSKVPVNGTVSTAKVVLKLPICLKFQPDNNFTETPRLFLTNATTKTPESRLNHAFLSDIILDNTTGEIHRSALPALSEWPRHGSIMNVLKDLQKKVTNLLCDYVQHAVTGECTTTGEGTNAQQGARPTSTPSPPPKQQYGSQTQGAESDDVLDWLLVNPGGAVTPAGKPPKPANTKLLNGVLDAESKCVICLEEDKTVVVMPCRHLALCPECSKKYQDRIADKMLCPLCRGPIRELIPIFL